MPRHLITAAAQMGPIARSETRADTVRRLVEMLREARGRGAELVVFTEMALTTFFPRWLIEDEAELDSFYETEIPSAATRPLFDEAARLGIGFCLGYAELVVEGGGSGASTPRSSWTGPARSSASTAKCICPAMTSPSPVAPSSTLRSGISSRAIWAFRSFVALAA